MNIVHVQMKILGVPDPVIGKSSLPHFCVSADVATKSMRVCAFNQLDGTLDGYVAGGSE